MKAISRKFFYDSLENIYTNSIHCHLPRRRLTRHAIISRITYIHDRIIRTTHPKNRIKYVLIQNDWHKIQKVKGGKLGLYIRYIYSTFANISYIQLTITWKKSLLGKSTKELLQEFWELRNGYDENGRRRVIECTTISFLFNLQNELKKIKKRMRTRFKS